MQENATKANEAAIMKNIICLDFSHEPWRCCKRSFVFSVYILQD